MDYQDDVPLTPEQEKLKQYFTDEDSGKIPFERIDSPPYVPMPTKPGQLVAVILPFRKRKLTMP